MHVDCITIFFLSDSRNKWLTSLQRHRIAKASQLRRIVTLEVAHDFFLGKGKPFSTYHSAMNQAAEELCLKNPAYFGKEELCWKRPGK